MTARLLVLLVALSSACGNGGLPPDPLVGPEGPPGPRGEPVGDAALLSVEPSEVRVGHRANVVIVARGVDFLRDGATVDAGDGVRVSSAVPSTASTLGVTLEIDAEAAQGWRPIRVVSGARTLMRGILLAPTLRVLPRRALLQGAIVDATVIAAAGEPPLYDAKIAGPVFDWGGIRTIVVPGELPMVSHIGPVLVSPDAPGEASFILEGAASPIFSTTAPPLRMVSAPLPIAPRTPTAHAIGERLVLDGEDSLDAFDVPGPGILVVTVKNAHWALWPSPRFDALLASWRRTSGNRAIVPTTQAERPILSSRRSDWPAPITIETEFVPAALVAETTAPHDSWRAAQRLDPSTGALVVRGALDSSERDCYTLVVGATPVEVSLVRRGRGGSVFLEHLLSFHDDALHFFDPGAHFFCVSANVAAGRVEYALGVREVSP
jgi:hypothetical protein